MSTGATSLWKQFGVVKIARVPIGQLLLAALSYFFQRKLLYTALAAKGVVIFNAVLEDIREAIRRRRESWRESLREYDEGASELVDWRALQGEDLVKIVWTIV
jgi:hypothetical protein